MHKLVLSGGVAVVAICAFAVFSGLGGNAAAQRYETYESGGIAGCYGGGTECDDPPPARARPAPQGGGEFAGRWEGKTDGGNGVAEISGPDTSGRYRVQASVVSPSACSGSLEGRGTVRANVLSLSVPWPDGSQNLCRMTFSKSGNRVVVSEENCIYFHGASCGFDGTLTRKGAAPVAATKPVAPAGAWKFDGAMQVAYVHAIENPRVIAMVSCDDGDRVDMSVAAFQIGVIGTGVRATKGLLLQVTASTPAGQRSFATTVSSPAYGGTMLGNVSVDHAGGYIPGANLKLLSRSSSFKITAKTQTYTFPGNRSAEMLGHLRCR